MPVMWDNIDSVGNINIGDNIDTYLLEYKLITVLTCINVH